MQNHSLRVVYRALRPWCITSAERLVVRFKHRLVLMGSEPRGAFEAACQVIAAGIMPNYDHKREMRFDVCWSGSLLFVVCMSCAS